MNASEEAAMKALAHNYPECLISHATEEEDMYDHIDLWITNPVTGKRKSVDVKDKDEGRGVFVYLELSNVHGGPGWLYGKSDWIMFKTKDNWIMVDRLALVAALHTKLINNGGYPILYNKREVGYFQAYSRKTYGRKDIMIKVPLEFILSVSYKIINACFE